MTLDIDTVAELIANERRRVVGPAEPEPSGIRSMSRSIGVGGP
jgi:hypothetical protein